MVEPSIVCWIEEYTQIIFYWELKTNSNNGGTYSTNDVCWNPFIPSRAKHRWSSALERQHDKKHSRQQQNHKPEWLYSCIRSRCWSTASHKVTLATFVIMLYPDNGTSSSNNHVICIWDWEALWAQLHIMVIIIKLFMVWAKNFNTRCKVLGCELEPAWNQFCPYSKSVQEMRRSPYNQIIVRTKNYTRASIR